MCCLSSELSRVFPSHSDHCPCIDPKRAWSDTDYLSSLLYCANPNLPPCCVSIRLHLALPQVHCTDYCSAWNPPCSTSHYIFSMVETSSLDPTPSEQPMLQRFILSSAALVYFYFLNLNTCISIIVHFNHCMPSPGKFYGSVGPNMNINPRIVLLVTYYRYVPIKK